MFGGRGTVTRAHALVLAAMLLGSCAVAREPGARVDADYGATPPRATKGAPRGSRTPPTTTSPTTSVPTTPSGFSFAVTAPNGDRLPGVILQYRGSASGRVTTNADGVAAARVKPGSYKIDTVDCGTTTRIVLGGGSDFTVVPGRITRGTIGGIGWEPRFQPRVEVAAPTPPPWRIGEPFLLKVRVGDECAGSAPVRAAVSVEPYEYETTAPMSLASTPSMRTDANGWLTARFVCTARGDGDIALSDPRIGTRYTAVLGAVPRPSESSYCVG